MVESINVEDPIVNVDDIKRLKLAFLMQFFVQHRRRFRFPRLRLQELYRQVLLAPDTVLLCDCVARILRFLRQHDPSVCISSADEALDTFVGEKRTEPHRQALQAARGGHPLNDLQSASRALLLEHLIECVYDERPELSFHNAVLNAASKASREDPLFGSPSSNSDDDSVMIKAGQDASGSSYYYMDDLRLYRETPQSGLSSHWSVAVGPTTHQWTSFMSSLGPTGEEADLAHFLQQELFSFVRDCIENPYPQDLNSELSSAHILDKEAAELAEIRRLRGLPPLVAPPVAAAAATSSQPTEAAGSSAGSSSGNSTSTCPLTPPNGTPSVMVGGTSSVHLVIGAHTPEKKEPFTPPSTPGNVWAADSQSVASRCQYPNSAEAPQTAPEISPVGPMGDALQRPPASSSSRQQATDSPLRRPASGPIPSSLHPADSAAANAQPRSAPPPIHLDSCAGPTGMEQGQRRSSITHLLVSNQTDLLVGGPGSIYLLKQEDFPYRHDQHLHAGPQGTPGHPQSRPSASAPAVAAPSSRTMVFTSDLANEAALNFARTGMRITTFHSMHPAVHTFMMQNGVATGGATGGAGVVEQAAPVTQEQWENRKTKIARLEKIQSKLAKSKMASTPGAATVAAMQQQQLYATAAMAASGQPLPPGTPHPQCPVAVGQASMPPAGHHGQMMPRTGPMPMEMQQQQAGQLVRGGVGSMVGEREFDRAAWMQTQQRKAVAVDPFYGAGLPPSLDHGGVGPPVLVVPPNNACVYNSPQQSSGPPPPPNRYCFPPPPPHKRPYPPDMTAPEQQFWDQQQAVFEQQQHALMMQQQQQQQMSVVSPPIQTTGGGGRGNAGRSGGLGKKRKTNAASANRSAPNRPQPMSPFGCPQRLPPAVSMKPGGFGSVPIGPTRGDGAPPTPYHQHGLPPGAGDPLGGGYPNPAFRGMPGPPHMMDPSQHLCSPGGPLISPLGPSGAQFQQSQPLFQQAGCDSTVSVSPVSVSSGPTSSAAVSAATTASATAAGATTSTQHLTSASLASLARLSQLSGAEGPFSGTPHTSGGYSRMSSAPDMLTGYPPPPPNLDPSDPNCSLYATGGPYQQDNPQLSSQFMAQHPHGSFPSVSSTATGRCLTPNSAPPGLPTLVSPGISQLPPVSAPSSNPPSLQPSVSPAQHPPSIQVNNTFFNAQLNVQQMNYQHVNGGNGTGSGSSAQMQIQFMQHQQQHSQQQQRVPAGGQKHFGSTTNGVVNPEGATAAPPNHKVGDSAAVAPNVQITPKTPHTIQYLPSTTTAGASASAGVPSTPATAPGSDGAKQLQALQASSPATPAMSRLHQPAAVATGAAPTLLGRHQSLPQRPSKTETALLLQQQPRMTTPTPSTATGLGLPSHGVSKEMTSQVDGVYCGMQGVAKGPPAQFSIAVEQAASIQQPQASDNNPFDFPQGATTTYPPPRVNPSSASSASIHQHQHQQQQQYPLTGPPYMSAEFSSKMTYVNEMSYQHQRWQQQQQQQHQLMSMAACGDGGEFYMQQQQHQQMVMSTGQQPQHYYVSQQQQQQQHQQQQQVLLNHNHQPQPMPMAPQQQHTIGQASAPHHHHQHPRVAPTYPALL